MRRDSLLRSTPFRLALLFSVMFVGAFVLTGLGVFQLARWELRQHQDQAIRETYAVIANAYGDRDLTDLLETVETNVRATRDHQRVFLVMAPDGRVLGGNIPAVALPAGWSEVRGTHLGLEPDLGYRLYAGFVDGNRLIVGLSQQEIDNLEEIIWLSFAWATAVVAVFGVSGGMLIATRARRRFDAVRDAMDAVSHGNLAARIPLIGKGDDLDLLSSDINEALSRLVKSVEGMRQVSTDIAHDLKTPLNRLRMTVDEALEKQKKGDPVLEDLVDAASEADRINQTFEALLRIAQIETGSRKSQFEQIDLGDLAASLSEIYADVAQDAGDSLQLEVDGSGNSLTIAGDRELLTQMFANLIENAIRHCPSGSCIKLRVERTGSTVVAAAEDNGLGIPEEEREKVFRRLYRLEKSRTSQGSGLGLSLVKAVAELHDASVRLEDAHPGLRIKIAFHQLG